MNITEYLIESGLMKNFTPEQMRELDFWLARNVTKLESCEFICATHSIVTRDRVKEDKRCPWCAMQLVDELPKYTLKAAHAVTILESCNSKLDCEDIRIGFCTGVWTIQSVFRECPGERGRIIVYAKTFELGICLFAQKLFTT